MMTKGPGGFEEQKADSDRCSVCRELLNSLGRFFDMIRAASPSKESQWLTVEEIAQELKISKSIVYRLIRNGELEAVDIVVGDAGEIHQKGHYRVRRSALERYLDAKKVRPVTSQSARLRPSRQFPKVKNHLGL